MLLPNAEEKKDAGICVRVDVHVCMHVHACTHTDTHMQLLIITIQAISPQLSLIPSE